MYYTTKSCKAKAFFVLEGNPRGGWRTKAGQGMRPVCAGDIWKDAETLNVSKHRRTGAGAIHQEIFMISRFSAPQAQDMKSFACPVRNACGTLRFSHLPTDARQTHKPPALACFLVAFFGDLLWVTVSKK